MTHPAHTAPPVAPTPPAAAPAVGYRVHVPDAVRAAMVLVGLGVLTNFTLLNDHLIFGVIAWVLYALTVGLAIAMAARIFLLDARTPTDGPIVVARTRLTNLLQEIVMAGSGALIVAGCAAYPIAVSSQEMWAGKVEPAAGLNVAGLLFAMVFGVAGLALVVFRPQFALDAAAGTVVRYPFGRSFPVGRKSMPYGELKVGSEGWFITNTGQRLGDIVRGRIAGYTFELERIRGNHARETVDSIVAQWAARLGVRSLTAEQMAAEELKNG